MQEISCFRAKYRQLPFLVSENPNIHVDVLFVWLLELFFPVE